MLRSVRMLVLLLVALVSLSGCIVPAPGYYPYDRSYYYEPYYPYYYGPSLYAPFWFGGYYRFGGGHGSDGHRGFEGRGGGHGRH